jgi:hypothetical protein
MTEEDPVENIRDAIHEYFATSNDLFPDGEVRETEIAVSKTPDGHSRHWTRNIQYSLGF